MRARFIEYSFINKSKRILERIEMIKFHKIIEVLE